MEAEGADVIVHQPPAVYYKTPDRVDLVQAMSAGKRDPSHLEAQVTGHDDPVSEDTWS